MILAEEAAMYPGQVEPTNIYYRDSVPIISNKEDENNMPPDIKVVVTMPLLL
jgi:hypothetical protein